MDGKNFRLIYGLKKLTQEKTVSNSAEKRTANCSNKVTTGRKLELLPTHKQEHYFAVSTRGFS